MLDLGRPRREHQARPRPVALAEFLARIEERSPFALGPICPEHGEEYCPRCAEASATAAWLARDRAAALAGCGVPERYRLDWPEWRAMEWDGSGLVVLTGGVGTMKTSHAAELLWRWIRPRQARARFVKAAAIPDLAFDNDKSAYRQLLAHPLVLVDDVGRGYKGDAGLAVANFLGDRYDRMTSAATICTTNALTEAEIGDPATVDRLRVGTQINFAGKSRRTERQDEPYETRNRGDDPLARVRRYRLV